MAAGSLAAYAVLGMVVRTGLKRGGATCCVCLSIFATIRSRCGRPKPAAVSAWRDYPREAIASGESVREIDLGFSAKTQRECRFLLGIRHFPIQRSGSYSSLCPGS